VAYSTSNLRAGPQGVNMPVCRTKPRSAVDLSALYCLREVRPAYSGVLATLPRGLNLELPPMAASVAVGCRSPALSGIIPVQCGQLWQQQALIVLFTLVEPTSVSRVEPRTCGQHDRTDTF
jgi:hypothetical protein